MSSCELWFMCRNATSTCYDFNKRKCNIYMEFRIFLERTIEDVIQYKELMESEI